MQSEKQAPLPVRLVAGPHSGRNAEWIVASAPPGGGRGRWLWLVGALQRPLASAALDRACAAVRGRLLIDGLPGGCPCCAAGAQLAAGLVRVLRRQRRDGQDIAGLILQVEPEGDPSRLADNLMVPEVEAWLRIDAISAVVGAADLAGSMAPGRTPRTMRCLGAASRVYLQEGVASPVATRLGSDWEGTLVPRPDGALAIDRGPGLGAGAAIAPEAGTVAGWTALDHDPFGSRAAGEPWQVLARWPGSVRFDRRAVAGWLDDLGQRLATPASGQPGDRIELALIARTERDWLGWQPGAIEVPLTWRSDSRIAWRRVDHAGPPAATSADAAVGTPVLTAPAGVGVPFVTESGLATLPADIGAGLAVAPLLDPRG